MNTALLVAADRIDDAAAVLRARAVLIGLHGATLAWRSPAAGRYLRRLDEVTVELSGCAARVAELADLVRQHAAGTATR